jgi:16S rRNA (guanine527-N7)-methyltransferase
LSEPGRPDGEGPNGQSRHPGSNHLLPDPAADSEDQHHALAATCQALGLAPSPGQLDAMVEYLALLVRWNRTYNLTAIRDPRGMLVQHLADCLAAVAALQRASAPAPAPMRILDVGSGGGLPGVLLALWRPDWHVTCLDAVAKKTAFVRQVAGALSLPNLQVHHGRVEARRGAPFELITARAFASLPDLVRLTREHLAAGGRWLAMKGQVPDDEIAALPADVEAFHVEPLVVPGLDAKRCIVWMRLRRHT